MNAVFYKPATLEGVIENRGVQHSAGLEVIITDRQGENDGASTDVSES